MVLWVKSLSFWKKEEKKIGKCPFFENCQFFELPTGGTTKPRVVLDEVEVRMEEY
jgi:hypothetical protein